MGERGIGIHAKRRRRQSCTQHDPTRHGDAPTQPEFESGESAVVVIEIALEHFQVGRRCCAALNLGKAAALPTDLNWNRDSFDNFFHDVAGSCAGKFCLRFQNDSVCDDGNSNFMNLLRADEFVSVEEREGLRDFH